MSLIPDRYRCPGCDGYLCSNAPALRCTCPEPFFPVDRRDPPAKREGDDAARS
jgi:hypothetical protein